MSRASGNLTSLPRAAEGDIESVILEAIRSLRYGSVEVIIHNAKVVQVERKEKLRFAPQAGS